MEKFGQDLVIYGTGRPNAVFTALTIATSANGRSGLSSYRRLPYTYIYTVSRKKSGFLNMYKFVQKYITLFDYHLTK